MVSVWEDRNEEEEEAVAKGQGDEDGHVQVSLCFLWGFAKKEEEEEGEEERSLGFSGGSWKGCVVGRSPCICICKSSLWLGSVCVQE